MILFSEPVPCVEYRVVDGDTWYCDGKKIRGFGIQAPEMTTNKCKKIECIPGDPIAARDALAAELSKGRLTYRYRVKKDGTPLLDPYNRLQGIGYSDGKSIFCAPLKAKLIIHKPDYDRAGIVLGECR